MLDIRSVILAVRDHARLAWLHKVSDTKSIDLYKIDFAKDLTGSFQMSFNRPPAQELQDQLDLIIQDVLSDSDSNFLSMHPDTELHVRHGNNILSTCAQYEVLDSDRLKLLTIKAYDKVLDLLSREGPMKFGSRAATVVGSRRDPNSFCSKVANAGRSGLTRLEVSIHTPALLNYNPC